MGGLLSEVPRGPQAARQLQARFWKHRAAWERAHPSAGTYTSLKLLGGIVVCCRRCTGLNSGQRSCVFGALKSLPPPVQYLASPSLAHTALLAPPNLSLPPQHRRQATPKQLQQTMARPLRSCSAATPQAEVHLLPAIVEHSGPAPVSAYFQPRESGAPQPAPTSSGGRSDCRRRQAPPCSLAARSLAAHARLPPAQLRAGAVVDGLPVLQSSLRGRNLQGACPAVLRRCLPVSGCRCLLLFLRCCSGHCRCSRKTRFPSAR